MNSFPRLISSPKSMAVIGLITVTLSFAAGWYMERRGMDLSFRNVNSSKPSATSATKDSASSTVTASSPQSEVSPKDSSELESITDSELSKKLTGIMALADTQQREVALLELTQKLPSNQIQTVLDHLAAAQPKLKWNQIQEEIVDLWAARDCKAALQYAERVPFEERKLSYMLKAIQQWAKQEAPGAIAYMQTVQDQLLRESLEHNLFHAVAATDPDRAIQLAKEHFSAEDFNRILGYQIIPTVAEKNPQRAAELTSQIPPGQMRNVCLWNLTSQMAKKDPAATFAWAQSLEDPTDRRRAQQGALEIWGKTDPQSAISHLQEMKDNHGKSPLFYRLFNDWLDKDLNAAKDYLSTAKPDEFPAMAYRQCAIKMVAKDPLDALAWIKTIKVRTTEVDACEQSAVELWAKKDAKEAANYVVTSMTGNKQQSAMYQVLPELTQKNPREALDWAHKLESKQMQYLVIQETMNKWAKQDPKAAADYARSGLDGREQSKAMYAVFSRWGEINPQEAAVYAATLPDGQLKSHLVSDRIVPSFAASDPKSAAAFVEKLPEADKPRNAGTVAANWVTKDPVAASTWATSLTEGKARTEAMDAVIYRWAESDPTKASEWLATLPTGASRDGAVNTFTNKIADKDPETAMKWAGSISDQTARTQSQQQVAAAWLKNNPGAAKAWIGTSDLPQDAKDKLLAGMDKK